MPLFPIENIDGVYDNTKYVWFYSEGEELIDSTIITNITALIINPEVYKYGSCLLRVPSLKIFENSNNLKILTIINLDIYGMTIPKSVCKLNFENTNLTNLNKINIDWNNISGLSL